MTRFHLTARARTVSAAAAVAAAAAASVALLTSGTANAGSTSHAVPAPPAAPTKAAQIQNIDQVKTAIKGYYGDRPDTTTVDPVTGAKDLHTFDPHGAYSHEMNAIVKRAEGYLRNPKGHRQAQPGVTGQKAVIFDVDDTTLNTYNYEIYSNFVYNPTSNAAFVNAGVFPAVPHMPDLLAAARNQGYTIFFLTGRPESQRAGTVANLASAGYAAPDTAHLYLKDLTKPIYSSCAPSCTTIQYKSLTRAYIQSQGYELYANFGDQYSDLSGGYADKTFKLPNPMYYLP